MRAMKTQLQVVMIQMRAQEFKTESKSTNVKLIVDNGVTRTLISEGVWREL